MFAIFSIIKNNLLSWSIFNENNLTNFLKPSYRRRHDPEIVLSILDDYISPNWKEWYKKQVQCIFENFID